jgi:hypothetical protein
MYTLEKDYGTVAKKKPRLTCKSPNQSRLDEFLAIAKINQLEASAAKDRQETLAKSQEIFGPFKAQ